MLHISGGLSYNSTYEICIFSLQELQPSMGPDAELFAEMAQDLLLGPSQANVDARAAQPGHPGAHTGPHAAQFGSQPQAWQPPASQPAPSAQQQQQQQQPQQVVRWP